VGPLSPATQLRTDLPPRWTEKFQAIYASGEDAASSRRRRDALVRKAKEYQEELDAIKVLPLTETGDPTETIP
jgi:hypothetical protein